MGLGSSVVERRVDFTEVEGSYPPETRYCLYVCPVRIMVVQKVYTLLEWVQFLHWVPYWSIISGTCSGVAQLVVARDCYS